MKRAIATYEKKYKIKLDKPGAGGSLSRSRGFRRPHPGHARPGRARRDVRLLVAMDSPSGRTPGSFHWATTLWHEMSHVFTLTVTGHRVPRWFTEGLAVHEETAASPDWGDRLGPDVIAAIKDKKLLPVADLDRGFIHPIAPQQVMVSYFQAGQICDYINEKWGWDTLLAMLHDFGAGEDTATVVRKELKIEPEEFDKEISGLPRSRNQEDRGALRRMEEDREVAGRNVGQDQGLGRRHQTGHRDPRPVSRLRRGRTASTKFSPTPTSPRTTSPPPSPNWSATSRSAAAIPNRIKQLAKSAGGGRPQEGSRRRTGPLELHLSRWMPPQHRSLGGLWLDAGQRARRHPRISAPCWRAIRSTRRRPLQSGAAPTRRTNRPSRRKTNCWPHWKPPRASGPRRSCCWN